MLYIYYTNQKDTCLGDFSKSRINKHISLFILALIGQTLELGRILKQFLSGNWN